MTRSTLSLICCGLSPGVSPGGHLTVSESAGSVVRRRADPPIVPYTPILFLLPDVFRQHAFVFAVIPFADFWLGLKAAFWWGVVTEELGEMLIRYFQALFDSPPAQRCAEPAF